MPLSRKKGCESLFAVLPDFPPMEFRLEPDTFSERLREFTLKRCRTHADAREHEVIFAKEARAILIHRHSDQAPLEMSVKWNDDTCQCDLLLKEPTHGESSEEAAPRVMAGLWQVTRISLHDLIFP